MKLVKIDLFRLLCDLLSLYRLYHRCSILLQLVHGNPKRQFPWPKHHLQSDWKIA